jgi:hypothetical protein
MDAPRARVLKPTDGPAGRLGGMGVRFLIGGDDSGGGFALVEHPMPPRALGAPLHRHSREDEYTSSWRVGSEPNSATRSCTARRAT